MKSWQLRLEQLLGAQDAPPVLTRDLLTRFARTANDNRTVPASSLTYWHKAMVGNRKLQPVQRGLHINRFRSRPGTLADSVPWLRNDAVVSLNTVLGDSGVLNNPSHTVTAVVPIDRNATPPPRLGRRKSHAGTLHFFGIPRHILQSGSPDDRLEPPDLYEHPRATPEKALVDWLYLGLSPRSDRSIPPRDDIDLELLRLPRLKRLAAAADMKRELANWLERSSRS